MSLSDELASFVVKTNFEDIPGETVDFIKHLASKIVAAMLYGATTRAGRGSAEYVRAKNGPLEAGIIGAGMRCLAEDAVFVNGVTAHAAELEDDQMPCATSDINIFPVIFPLIQTRGLTGKQVIAASAVGLEVMNRIGLRSISSQGITDLPFFGVIGSAVTAAKALQLTEAQVSWAMGLALGRAGGYIVNFGTDAHFVESAAACRDGLMAAELARRDLTGTRNLEKWLREDVWRDPGIDLGPITAGLGRTRWRVHETWVKKYPCCFLTHRHIDLMLEILKEKGLTPERIAKIEIDCGPVDSTCDRPSPLDPEDARFSFQHIMACLMLYGEIDSHHFTWDMVKNPEIAKERGKVTVYEQGDWPKEFMSGTARIAVTLADGKVIEQTRPKALGSPDEPLTEDRFRELFFKYTRPVLSEKNAEWVWRALIRLEELDRLDELARRLIYPE